MPDDKITKESLNKDMAALIEAVRLGNIDTDGLTLLANNLSAKISEFNAQLYVSTNGDASDITN